MITIIVIIIKLTKHRRFYTIGNLSRHSHISTMPVFVGIATYIADDFDNVILGYHNALITPNSEKLNGKYLNALFYTDYARTYFANNASGSGQRYALSVDALNNFPIPLIPLAEQKRIGDIFSSIDQKIALNRQINQNLRAS